MDYSKLTLGELLSSENETIKRNAVSILKQLQKGYWCYIEHKSGKYASCSVPHFHEYKGDIENYPNH